jgi:preprotein translocase subunit SecG
MVYILLVLLHVIVCLFLVVVVLLQSGKAADLAGAFGGMGSQTAFGPRGSATILSKATTIAAALFMVTSMTLAILATRGVGGPGTTVLEEQPRSAPSRPAQSRPAPRAPGQASIPVTAPGAGTKTVTIPLTPNTGKPGQPAPAAPAKK